MKRLYGVILLAHIASTLGAVVDPAKVDRNGATRKCASGSLAAVAASVQSTLSNNLSPGDGGMLLLQRGDTTQVSTQSETKALLSKRSTVLPSDQVRECFKKQAEREKRQAGIGGFFGFIGNVVSTIGNGLLGGCGALLTQTNTSSSSVSPSGCAVAAVASGVGSIVTGVTDNVHKAQDANAQNCHELSATLTLDQIKEMSDKLSNQIDQAREETKAGFEATIKAISAEVRVEGARVSRKLDAVLSQVSVGQMEMRYLTRKLDDRMMQASRDAAILATKLDRVLNKISETQRAIDSSMYHQLSAKLSSSLSTAAAAFDDLVHVMYEIKKHDDALHDMEHWDRNTLDSWTKSTPFLLSSLRSEVQNSWQRARDSFISAIAVLTEGDFLKLHYTMLIQGAIKSHLEANAFAFAKPAILGTDSLMSAVKTEFGEDTLLPTLAATTIRVVGMLQILLSTEAVDFQRLNAFRQSIMTLDQYLKRMREEFSGTNARDGVATTLQTLLPLYFPISEDCRHAAMAHGETKTDDMAQWTADKLVLSIARLMTGEAGQVYDCIERPTSVQSNVNKLNFDPANKIYAGDVTPEKQPKCDAGFRGPIYCPPDYYLDVADIDREEVTCACNSHPLTAPESHNVAHTSFTWTCTIQGRETHLMCRLSPNAASRTVSPGSTAIGTIPTFDLITDGDSFSVFSDMYAQLKQELEKNQPTFEEIGVYKNCDGHHLGGCRPYEECMVMCSKNKACTHVTYVPPHTSWSSDWGSIWQGCSLINWQGVNVYKIVRGV